MNVEISEKVVTVYFACDEETYFRAAEKSGAPGLDEHRDTMWVRFDHKDSYTVVFHDTGREAFGYALKNNLPFIYEGRVPLREISKYLNSSLSASGTFLDIMTKRIGTATVKGV